MKSSECCAEDFDGGGQYARGIKIDPVRDGNDSVAVRTVTVEDDCVGQRIDNYLIRVLKGVPKSRVYRMIRRGEVRANKKRVRASYRLNVGDLIRIPPLRQHVEREKVSLDSDRLEWVEEAVLYEDDALIVINKPTGLAVHGGSGISLGLIELLRAARPGSVLELVHRLDRETSGCLMVAKKRSMLRYLHRLMREGELEKIYSALVVGRWPTRRQRVSAPLVKNVLKSGERMVTVDHDAGRSSTTLYRVLHRFSANGVEATLLEARPITGRTHQIRVHCLYAGAPIVGDRKYLKKNAVFPLQDCIAERMFLHAAALQLILPGGKPLRVEAPPGDAWCRLLNRLQQLDNG